MGTVQFWTKWVVRVSRLIPGGKMGDVKANVDKFVNDVSLVAGTCEPEMEGNRGGLCLITYVRCKDMDEVNSVIERFRNNGWRVS